MSAEPYCPEPAPEEQRDEDHDAEDHGLTPWDYDLPTLIRDHEEIGGAASRFARFMASGDPAILLEGLEDF